MKRLSNLFCDHCFFYNNTTSQEDVCERGTWKKHKVIDWVVELVWKRSHLHWEKTSVARFSSASWKLAHIFNLVISENQQWELPWMKINLKVVNNVFFPYFFGEFFWKNTNVFTLWACRKLFSNFATMQNFAQKKCWLEKNKNKFRIYFYF